MAPPPKVAGEGLRPMLAELTPPSEGEGLRVMGLPNWVRRELERKELLSWNRWVMFIEGEGLLLVPESCWWILDRGGLTLCCDMFQSYSSPAHSTL